MKYKDIKDLSKKELLSKRKVLMEKVFGIKMKSHMKQSGNPLEIRSLRRDIARVNTVLSSVTDKAVKEASIGKVEG